MSYIDPDRDNIGYQPKRPKTRTAEEIAALLDPTTWKTTYLSGLTSDTLTITPKPTNWNTESQQEPAIPCPPSKLNQ